MGKSSYLLQRGGTYYFVRRYPKDVASYFAPSKQRWLSTGTSDRAAAKIEVHRLAAAFDAEMQRIRAERGPQRPLAEEDIGLLCERYRAMSLQTDAELRDEGLDESDYEAVGDVLDAGERQARAAFGRGAYTSVDEVASDLLDAEQLSAVPSSRVYLALCKALLETELKTLAELRRRHQGESIAIPEVPPAPGRGGDFELRAGELPRQTDPLQVLHGYWKRRAKPGDKAADEAMASITEFYRVIKKQLPVRDIKRQHALLYRNYLVDEKKRHEATARKKLGLLAAIVQVCVDEFVWNENPFSRISFLATRKEHKRDKPRLPFTTEHLKIIFSGPRHTGPWRPGISGADFFFPLLVLFGGFRPEELAQANLSDLKCVAGVWYLEVTARDDDQETKTVGSQRKGPIHAMLRRFGFFAYVDYIRQEGHKKLFPGLKPDKYGSYSQDWSDKFSKYLRRTLKITDRKVTFYSFRHSFREFCDTSGVSWEVAESLLGHLKKGYGHREVAFEKLVAGIAKLTVTGIDLSHLYYRERHHNKRLPKGERTVRRRLEREHRAR